MPAVRAAAATGTSRSRLPSIEQLVLRLENVSDAAANIAISATSAVLAASSPCRFGTSTG